MSSHLGLCLDWRAPWHWAALARPCVHCHAPTHLRDDDRRPSCKVCAEGVLAARLRAATTTYDAGRLG